jgi:hypothetical protein
MTARQQRRLEQKLARKAAKRAARLAPETFPPTESLAAAALAGASMPDSSEELAGRARAVAGPIGDAKLAANRANALLSTGAITDAGKAIVSQNATKHGLTGRFKVLACESQSQFDELLAGFLKSEAPVGDDEIEMVQQMAEALWLSRRSMRLQNDCFEALVSSAPAEQKQAERQLALYLRYQTTHDRTFSRYATELRKRRNERARAERGFVSQKYKEAAERRRIERNATQQAGQNLKQEAQQIRNRVAAVKAEALELKNLAKKASLPAQNSDVSMAAAA